MKLRRIVLIDDCDDDNFINQRFLELAGWTESVEAYTDPLVGCEAVEASPPDLLFVDLNMPRLSGVEVLERLSGRVDGAALRVVVLTSSMRYDDRARVDATGLVNAYVEKPLGLEQLERLAVQLDI